ncbi:TPA: xanthine dehydrogenase family protein molybdopterin-binding subunit [Xanthomonas vasicola pv. zeae]|uniref:xanthine dehydrogenase family protein molybdopterin-binding subunit n=1 Tax=Xanthomonas vasicola TaxID=56459 RepID=UPI000345003C|nr:xanthine dehydrogenase family protein molybdopterin-binding subunit [Xanthomonas vasicola]KFA37168.1 aldehyde oxidase [Xanthomonas vasicola pv. vasculorum NCPPB 206]MDO6953041.1 xanthine dehydrogenase family protein molybdopterin-binding subunit [Xanthomonas vasicola]HHZ24221.1 xanthine dehydrogenase family protein molybdopterin-binding subunit [Xanthomonas vasicola pv. zeae]HHZ28355.1 xanthine dehydrogenase family protein molybdopterin-binding subunit [Xanthomonas vasicola pv. zeae]HHZ3619
MSAPNTDLFEHDLSPPVADNGTGYRPTGTGVTRIDGRAKVTGQARYAAEWPVSDLAYGVVVNSSIAKGEIVAFHLEAARAVPGVLEIVTHENRPHMRGMDLFYKDMTAPAGSPFRPLYDNKILYSGQPIALVVAETFEAARHAAHLVEVELLQDPHDTNLMTNLDRAHTPKPLKAGFSPPPKDKGKPDAAFDNAECQIQADYYSGVEHHNPMELFASTVIRDADGHFTIYDKTQGSQNSRWYVSHVFGLSKRKVTVRNPYVGGAFGSGLRPQYQLPLAVMASILLDRSVRVVLTRQQMFTFGHRPETLQRLKLGADRDGTLRSVWHEAIAETSRIEDYVEVVVNWSGQLYACDNVHLGYTLVSLDQYSPIDMRAPGAAHGVHALEVAMDELSYEVGIDPLALRLKNYAEVNPADDKPYSTKALRQCYEQGAERFGWAQRPLQPRARKEGSEWVGWGMATGQWDAMQMFARAHTVLHADGRLVVSSAASDIGTGTYTVMAMIAAEALGLPLEQVTFQLGDSTLPVAPIEGGSSHVTTVGSAVDGACGKLRGRLLRLAQALPDSRFAKAKNDDVVFASGKLALRADAGSAIALTELLRTAGLEQIEDKFLLLPNVLNQRKYTRATHGAVFVEVRVDEELGTVRVTRVVSAIAAGRILNPITARSQIVGGVVWGIGQALHEHTQSDHRFGRFMNHDLALYHVSANADIHDIDVIFADEDDRIVSRLGAKGVGEIGLVGVSAAICNAIFHATGKRIRSTPMTPDKVMAE